MIDEGTQAPTFELPAVDGDEQRSVAVEEYFGEDVVVLAFYPGDFNPACDEESCGLDALDLFTMQKDVTILGISPDSVYSHRAFADRYDLHIPLLSDTDHAVAEQYGVDTVDDLGQRLVDRAVVVVDHDGVVQYTWSTENPGHLPDVGAIKDAIAQTGGDDTAFARYRVGHAHYTEARRAFTSAMHGFRDSEWMMAQRDFQQAREEFEAAAEQFDTAVRFVDDPDLEAIYAAADEKAGALWQAADWLTEAASAYSSGSGAEGQQLRDDAEGPLETARGFRDPPDPDGPWPPEIDDMEKSEQRSSILPEEEAEEDATLDVDIDEAAGEGAADTDRTAAESADATGADDPAGAGEPAAAAAEADDAPVEDAGNPIDDAELEEIQEELAAENPDEEPGAEAVTEEPTSMVDEYPAESDEGEAGEERGDSEDDEDVSLELTDPTDEGE